jgi:F-type H+-transporting ATPase subunit b
MLIDWFTVAAQGLNFLVLVWLLRRYLYKPVLAAIDKREKQIAVVLAEAASKKTAAEQEGLAFAAKNAAFDTESAAVLKKAAAAAEIERARLLADAGAQADALRTQQMSALHDDEVKLSQEVARRVQEEVLAITRKLLADLAGASLEAQMIAVFAKRLRDWDSTAKKDMLTALGSPPQAVVRSAFELPPAQKLLVQNAVDEAFKGSTTLSFETLPEILCGVQLIAAGRKLAWSDSDYLAGLEQRMVAAPAAVPTS